VELILQVEEEIASGLPRSVQTNAACHVLRNGIYICFSLLFRSLDLQIYTIQTNFVYDTAREPLYNVPSEFRQGTCSTRLLGFSQGLG
jgi:hypothetical protein